MHQIVGVAGDDARRQRPAPHGNRNVGLAQRIGERQHALAVAAGGEVAGRLRQDREQELHLFGTAAGEQRHQALGRVETVRRQGGTRLAGRPHTIEQGMPDEVRAHALGRVERRLERKDHRQPVDAAGDLADATPTPRPDLRADVVEHGDTVPVRDPRQRQVELGEVDQDQEIGTLVAHQGPHGAVGPPDGAEPLAYLQETHGGDRSRVDQRLHADGTELGAADAAHAHAGHARA